MAGTLSAIIAAIETRLTALSFKATEEVFDFDAVPNSIIDKAYRIESRQIKSDYNMDHNANPKEEISIYIAYKPKQKPRTVWKVALDDRETIEKDLISAAGISGLSSDPLLTMNTEATTQKEKGNYLISRLVFTADYLRDVTP
jgi:hypothetical protein